MMRRRVESDCMRSVPYLEIIPRAAVIHKDSFDRKEHPQSFTTWTPCDQACHIDTEEDRISVGLCRGCVYPKGVQQCSTGGHKDKADGGEQAICRSIVHVRLPDLASLVFSLGQRG